jgi:hypothetical protein
LKRQSPLGLDSAEVSRRGDEREFGADAVERPHLCQQLVRFDTSRRNVKDQGLEPSDLHGRA